MRLLLITTFFLQVMLGTSTTIKPKTYSLIPANESPDILNLEESIQQLQQDTIRLNGIKEVLVKKCNETFAKLIEEYNRLLAKLKEDTSEIKNLEQQLVKEQLNDKSLTRALNQVEIQLKLLSLKKNIMAEDIGVLRKRQPYDYETCKQYGGFFNFTPNDEIGVRSLQSRAAGLPSYEDNEDDVYKIVLERRKVWLRLRKDSEEFKNNEMKSAIKFYSGYCERKIAYLKGQIEILKSYPKKNVSKEDLIQVLENVKANVDRKNITLNDRLGKLQIFIQEIEELQKQYDNLRNEANCFIKLDQWHIFDEEDKLEKLVKRANDGDILKTSNHLPVNPLNLKSDLQSDVPSKIVGIKQNGTTKKVTTSGKTTSASKKSTTTKPK